VGSPLKPRVVVVLAVALLLGAAVARQAERGALQEIAWPDEAIYLVGARNVAERGSLDTNFYLAYSLLRRGYPHRDVHMPGYILALAPFVKAKGTTLWAGVALNLILYGGCILLVYALARGVLEDEWQAAAATALFTVLPPFPGYLHIVYPELLVAFAQLAALAWLVHARGMAGAVAAGVLYAAGALARETLLVSLPLYFARLPRREFWRGFAPAAAATLLLVVAPLSRDRAVHPNALYPSVLEEARRSEAPVATLAGTVWRNVALNLRLTAAARPTSNPEDAVLLLMAGLAAATLAARRRLPPASRPLAGATLLSLGVLLLAVLTLYVVRERGGVWGGVRALMPWAPVLLILATPLLFTVRRRAVTAALVLACGLGFAALDRWQSYFFFRYKQSDYEDQARNADYIARYLDAHRPARIASRSFLYGLSRYPVEVIWSLPRDGPELKALNDAVPYEFLVIHEKSPLRYTLMDNPRFLRVNKEDRGAEFLIWRRLY
jgi:hypothetical protein